MFLLGIVPYFIFRKIGNKIILYKLNNLLKNDCLNFDEKKLTKNEFFIKKQFIINSRTYNIHKLLSLIEPQECYLNNNLIYSDLIGK